MCLPWCSRSLTRWCSSPRRSSLHQRRPTAPCAMSNDDLSRSASTLYTAKAAKVRRRDPASWRSISPFTTHLLGRRHRRSSRNSRRKTMTRATAGSWRCRGGGAAAHLGEAPGGEGRGPMDIWISSSFYPNQSKAFGSHGKNVQVQTTSIQLNPKWVESI